MSPHSERIRAHAAVGSACHISGSSSHPGRRCYLLSQGRHPGSGPRGQSYRNPYSYNNRDRHDTRDCAAFRDADQTARDADPHANFAPHGDGHAPPHFHADACKHCYADADKHCYADGRRYRNINSDSYRNTDRECYRNTDRECYRAGKTHQYSHTSPNQHQHAGFRQHCYADDRTEYHRKRDAARQCRGNDDHCFDPDSAHNANAHAGCRQHADGDSARDGGWRSCTLATRRCAVLALHR